MHILYLSLRYPYPPTRGDRIRAYYFLRELAREHRVSVVSFWSRGDPEDERVLAEWCVHRWKVTHHPLRAHWNTVKALGKKEPLQNAFWFSEEMKRTVREALDVVTPDSIQVHLFRMAPYVVGVSTPKLLDLCDSMTMNLRRRKERESHPLLRYLVGIEERRVRDYEPKIARHFDRVLFIASPDRDAFRSLAPEIPAEVIPSGVDLDFFDPKSSFTRPDSPPILLFTGTMNYFPNLDASLYLVDEILPRVREVHPRTELFLVGACPPLRLVRRNGSKGVWVTGCVSDVRPYFDRATVFVSPMRCGSGLQTKNIEAMAMGVPLVTTTLGGNGLLAEPGKDYLRADDTESLVQAIVSLVADPEQRRLFAQRGRAYVEKEHDWKLIGQRLRTLHEEMVRKR